MRASLKTMNGKSQAGVQEGFKKFEPIATYHTTKVETIYHKKPVDRINVLGIYECDIVKTAGKLPELYRQADKSNILIERTGSGMHSPMVAKIDGRIVAMTTKGFEDRDEWEKGIEKMLEEALKMVQEKKKAR